MPAVCTVSTELDALVPIKLQLNGYDWSTFTMITPLEAEALAAALIRAAHTVRNEGSNRRA